MKVKAKVITIIGAYRPVIYVTGRWRSFATPHSPKDCEFKPHMTRKAAQRGAETTAKALGITLEWEETK